MPLISLGLNIGSVHLLSLLEGLIDVPIEYDEYVPTLTNVVLGTLGAGNPPQLEANYIWLGGEEVDDSGLLALSGFFRLADDGKSVGTNPKISLPPGFEWLALEVGTKISEGDYRFGNILAAFGATKHTGFCYPTLSNRGVGFACYGTSGQTLTITSTVPATWTTSSLLSWNVSGPAKRVAV